MKRLIGLLVGAFVMAGSAFADDAWTVTNTLTRRTVFSCADFTMSGGTIDSAGISTNVPGNRGDVGTNGEIRLTGGSLINGNAVAGPGKTIPILAHPRITRPTST